MLILRVFNGVFEEGLVIKYNYLLELEDIIGSYELINGSNRIEYYDCDKIFY